MIRRTKRDWKSGIAWLVFWSWAYALLINHALVWICVFLTAFSAQLFGTPVAIPVPPAPDWSLLMGATTTLLGIGGIEAFRPKGSASAPAGEIQTTSAAPDVKKGA